MDLCQCLHAASRESRNLQKDTNLNCEENKDLTVIRYCSAEQSSQNFSTKTSKECHFHHNDKDTDDVCEEQVV